MKSYRPVKKVVVCGTGFGTFYTEAVHRSPEFELAGIVAQGSPRSVASARHYGVPLYHRVEDVPDDVDTACVVIRSSSLGGMGTDMSLAFLERGIHVILEQPVHHDDLKRCFKSARAHSCCFMTGDMYLNMPEMRRFLQVWRYLVSLGQKPEYLIASSSVQAFYPFVEMLCELMPAGATVRLTQIGQQQSSFKVVSGFLGELPFTLEWNNEMNPRDPDNFMQLLHSFTAFFPGGRLELVDTRGPLLWYPRLNMPWSVLDGGCLPETYPEHMNEKSLQILTPDIGSLEQPYYWAVENSWVEGIRRDLLRLAEMAEQPGLFLSKAQREQRASRLWNDLTREIGYAALNAGLEPPSLVAADLTAKALLPEER